MYYWRSGVLLKTTHISGLAQAIQQVNGSLAAANIGVTVSVTAGGDESSDRISDGHAHPDFPAYSPYLLYVGHTTIKIL